jgi:hypothetical protein
MPTWMIAALIAAAAAEALLLTSRSKRSPVAEPETANDHLRGGRRTTGEAG